MDRTDLIEKRPDKHFDYLNPKEAVEKGFKVQRALISEDKKSGLEVEILKFPDVDLKTGMAGVHVSIISNSKHEGSSPFSQLFEMGLEVTQFELNPSQKERFNYCTGTLKLPIQIATTLTFDFSDEDIKNWPIPKKEAEIPTLLSVVGFARAGKSAVSAFFSTKMGVPFFNLDRFSAFSINKYVEEIKSAGLDRDCSGEDFLKTINAIFGKDPNLKKADTRAQSLKSTFKELAMTFKNGNRPKLMIIDGVGDKPEGIIPMNAYHMASFYSFGAVMLVETPKQFSDLSFEKNAVLSVEQEKPLFLTLKRKKKLGIGPQSGDVDTGLTSGFLDDTLNEFQKLVSNVDTI